MSGIQSFDNIGIAVRDVAKSADWYTRFGLTQEWADEGQAWLTAPGVALYLFRAVGAAQAPRSPDLTNNPPGIDHLSFAVTNLDETDAELARNGIQAERPPADQEWGARAALYRDPDGNCIWLLQR